MKRAVYFQVDCKRIEITKQPNQLVIRVKANLRYSPNESPSPMCLAYQDALSGLNTRYSDLYKSDVAVPQQQPQNHQPPQQAQPDNNNSMFPEQPSNKHQPSTNLFAVNQNNNAQSQSVPSGNQNSANREPPKANIFSIGTNNSSHNNMSNPNGNPLPGSTSFGRKIIPTATQPSSSTTQDNMFSRQGQGSNNSNNITNIFSQNSASSNNPLPNQQRGSSNMFFRPEETTPSIFAPPTSSRTLSNSRTSSNQNSRNAGKLRIQ